MSHDEVQAIIDEADKNGDGKLDYAEFCHMLLSTSEQCVRASTLKAKRTGSHAQSNSKPRHEQVKLQRHKETEYKSRSSPHQASGYNRRERRREEIRSQLYPVEHRTQELHLIHRRHPQHRTSGLEVGSSVARPLNYSSGGDRVQGYQADFVQEPVDLDYPENVHPPPAPAPESVMISGTGKAAYGEVKGTPTHTFEESNGDSQVKRVETNGVERGGEPTALQPPPSKPHPPPSEAQVQAPAVPVKATPTSPKPDLKSETESLTSVLPSSEQISDPFALPTSLPKFPPLRKSSLPPLLPPIGGTITKDKMEGAEKQPEGKIERGKESQVRERLEILHVIPPVWCTGTRYLS